MSNRTLFKISSTDIWKILYLFENQPLPPPSLPFYFVTLGMNLKAVLVSVLSSPSSHLVQRSRPNTSKCFVHGSSLFLVVLPTVCISSTEMHRQLVRCIKLFPIDAVGSVTKLSFFCVFGF